MGISISLPDNIADSLLRAQTILKEYPDLVPAFKRFVDIAPSLLDSITRSLEQVQQLTPLLNELLVVFTQAALLLTVIVCICCCAFVRVGRVWKLTILITIWWGAYLCCEVGKEFAREGFKTIVTLASNESQSDERLKHFDQEAKRAHERYKMEHEHRQAVLEANENLHLEEYRLQRMYFWGNNSKLLETYMDYVFWHQASENGSNWQHAEVVHSVVMSYAGGLYVRAEGSVRSKSISNHTSFADRFEFERFLNPSMRDLLRQSMCLATACLIFWIMISMLHSPKSLTHCCFCGSRRRSDIPGA